MMEHKQAAAGRWNELSLIEQMANVGCEVERAISWRKRGNDDYSQKAFKRVLELLTLTIVDLKNKNRLKELTRAREALIDYFFGDNLFLSSDRLWKKYFYPFFFAARINK